MRLSGAAKLAQRRLAQVLLWAHNIVMYSAVVRFGVSDQNISFVQEALQRSFFVLRKIVAAVP